ncbi:secretory carrier-associated membrane protein [Entomortierella parvispora]|uniref:Secretory carrier-associated membrane protein n=1 Tax=Entomortierella parvispora TaxID=205924 RepID=A0A9P3HLU2_9FUNG|nr:secretory carrier-associated membrane protein [Entomortierella parvispora]
MSGQNPFEHAEFSQTNPFEDANQIQADVPLHATNKSEVEQEYTSYTQYGDSSFQTSSTAPTPAEDPKLAAKAAELRRREEELAAREREIQAAQAEAERVRTQGKNNFPKLYPLIYMSIPAEIPKAHQSTVRFLYNIWLALLGTLALNFLACMLMLIAGLPNGGADLGVALGYCFTITASSFLLWYRPVYNAFMKEMSMYYYFYFIFNGFHIAFSFYMALGFTSTGSAGLINMISVFNGHHIFAGILCVFSTALWLVQGFGCLFFYRKVHQHYHQQGHTFDQAKAQVTSSAVRSQAVQNAAWSAATSGRV